MTHEARCVSCGEWSQVFWMEDGKPGWWWYAAACPRCHTMVNVDRCPVRVMADPNQMDLLI